MSDLRFLISVFLYRMNLYHSGALFKIFLACVIAYILYSYVNVYQQPGLALSFGFLCVFLGLRSLSYFCFVALYRIFTAYDLHFQIEKSYSLGLLTAMFGVIQLAMMIMGSRNILLGGVFTICFLLFAYIIAHGRSQST